VGARISGCLVLVVGLFATAAGAKEEPLTYPLRAGTPVILIAPDDASAEAPEDPEAETYELAGSYFMRNDHPEKGSPVWEKVDVPALRARLRANVVDAVAKQVVSGGRPILVQAPWSEEKAIAKTKDSNGLYVAVHTYFAFDPLFREIGAHAHIWVVRMYRSDSGKPKWDRYDWPEISFAYQLPDRRGQEYFGPERFWAAMDDARLQAMLEDSADEVGKMVSYQFSPEGRAELAGKRSKVKECNGVRAKGHVVKAIGDHCWYRPFASYGMDFDLAGVRPLSASEVPPPVPSTPRLR